MEQKKARATRVIPGIAEEESMGAVISIAIIRANMRKKWGAEATMASKGILCSYKSGISCIRFVVKFTILLIIQVPVRPIVTRIAMIFGTKVRVWS